MEQDGTNPRPIRWEEHEIHDWIPKWILNCAVIIAHLVALIFLGIALVSAKVIQDL